MPLAAVTLSADEFYRFFIIYLNFALIPINVKYTPYMITILTIFSRQILEFP